MDELFEVGPKASFEIRFSDMLEQNNGSFYQLDIISQLWIQHICHAVYQIGEASNIKKRGDSKGGDNQNHGNEKSIRPGAWKVKVTDFSASTGYSVTYEGKLVFSMLLNSDNSCLIDYFISEECGKWFAPIYEYELDHSKRFGRFQ